MRYTASIISSSVGNILEWYDFGLFTIFSALFSKLFFPTENPQTALIATFGIFAVGFLCRPIGALIFGYMGDRTGRAKTLRLSVLMIALPTILIGFLPTYSQVGIAAPIMLMLIRMWQGVSIGGEYSGNLIYLAETAPKRYRATFTAFACSGSNMGILLAGLVGFIASTFISEHTLSTWGWRFPYLLSGLLCLGIYFFRLNIQETHVFAFLKQKKRLTGNPIAIVFKKNRFELLRALGMVCMGSTFYFFSFVFLPIYLTENFDYSVHALSSLISALIFFMIFFIPCAGFICDRLGRRKMLLFNAFFILCFVILGFYFLQLDKFFIVAFVLTVFTLISSSEQGTTSVAMIENFPPPARYTGVSLSYNIGNGFLGGTVPMVCTWLNHFDAVTLLPAIYISFWALVTGLVIFYLVPETKQKSLV